jgi:hypothetical protein
MFALFTLVGAVAVGVATAVTPPNAVSVAELEKRIAATPDDLALRAELLERYFLDRTPEGRAARVRHILWVIEHAPEADVAGSPYAGVDHVLARPDFDRASALWLAHVAASPTNPEILAHAASFFLLADRGRAEELLERGARLEPDEPEWRRRLGHLHDLEAQHSATGSAPAKAALAHHQAALARTEGDTDRYFALSGLAEAARRAGETAKAREYALELLDLAEALPRDWNYGNAVHDGHRVLGHVALASGDVAGAREHLLAAGATPGSPQLDSFGPELTLAKDLLAAGERAAVVEYLKLCERFWTDHAPALRRWSAAIQAGETPDLERFGALLPQP